MPVIELNLPDGSGGYNSYDVKTDASAVTGLASKYRENSTAYAEGEKRLHSSLTDGMYLECTTPGISGATDITIPQNITVNTTVISDGSELEWTVRQIASTKDVAEATYDLPAATANDLGGVIVGDSLSITNGVLDVGPTQSISSLTVSSVLNIPGGKIWIS